MGIWAVTLVLGLLPAHRASSQCDSISPNGREGEKKKKITAPTSSCKHWRVLGRSSRREAGISHAACELQKAGLSEDKAHADRQPSAIFTKTSRI